jgi:hypothetical protein
MQFERGDHQEPQTYPTEQPVDKSGARQYRDLNPGGHTSLAQLNHSNSNKPAYNHHKALVACQDDKKSLGIDFKITRG